MLQKGTVMGCLISPILFTLAFEITLIGRRQTVCGVRSQSGQQLPLRRSYIDDITTLLQTVACTNRLLQRLDELQQCDRLKVKLVNSCSLSIRKGVKNDNISFSVNCEKI